MEQYHRWYGKSLDFRPPSAGIFACQPCPHQGSESFHACLSFGWWLVFACSSFFFAVVFKSGNGNQQHVRYGQTLNPTLNSSMHSTMRNHAGCGSCQGRRACLSCRGANTAHRLKVICGNNFEQQFVFRTGPDAAQTRLLGRCGIVCPQSFGDRMLLANQCPLLFGDDRFGYDMIESNAKHFLFVDNSGLSEAPNEEPGSSKRDNLSVK